MILAPNAALSVQWKGSGRRLCSSKNWRCLKSDPRPARRPDLASCKPELTPTPYC